MLVVPAIVRVRGKNVPSTANVSNSPIGDVVKREELARKNNMAERLIDV